MKRLKKTFLCTFVAALAFILLMLMFWPAETPVETVRALAPPGECVEEVRLVPIPFPVFVGGARQKGSARPAVDKWKCWYSDRLEDWMSGPGWRAVEVKMRHMKDEIKGLHGKIAKQAQTIEFLLTRIKTLKALLADERKSAKKNPYG